MSSIPNSYIDDLRSIVLATLNRIEQLRMRVLFGVQFVKGAYGQELEFRSDGKLYLDDVEVSSGGVTDHDALNNLNWAAAGHTIDSNIAMGANNITGVGSLSFGATPIVSTTDAGEILFKALTTSMLGLTKTLNTSYVPLDMNGQAITDAVIAGTNGTSFTLDQDGAGASTVLNFNTGGTAALSQLDGTVTLDLPEFDRFYIDINGASEYYFNADELAMYGNKISGLGAGAANGDAIRYEQLIGQYLLLSGGTLSGNLAMGTNSISNIGNLGFGAAPVITTTDAGTFTFKALTTTILSFTKTLITFAKELAMSGNKITGLGTPTADTDAATKGYADSLPGVDGVSFTIDQDNAGAGVNTALKFNRGSTDGDARILWNETNDRFDIEDDSGVTLAEVRTKQIDVQDQINLDDTTGTVMIKKNDTTGDMELQVASGDSIVFKAV